MRISRKFLNFNKEILFLEIGSLIGAQVFSHLASHSFDSIRLISFFAVIGSILGSSLWLVVRVYDTTRKENLSTRNILEDVSYFSPVAFLLSCIIYYPVLFFLSGDFLKMHFLVLSSIFIAQIIAFAIWLVIFNIYRYILMKKFGKTL